MDVHDSFVVEQRLEPAQLEQAVVHGLGERRLLFRVEHGLVPRNAVASVLFQLVVNEASSERGLVVGIKTSATSNAGSTRAFGQPVSNSGAQLANDRFVEVGVDGHAMARDRVPASTASRTERAERTSWLLHADLALTSPSNARVPSRSTPMAITSGTPIAFLTF
jgi:hypothetical protein